MFCESFDEAVSEISFMKGHISDLNLLNKEGQLLISDTGVAVTNPIHNQTAAEKSIPTNLRSGVCTIYVQNRDIPKGISGPKGAKGTFSNIEYQLTIMPIENWDIFLVSLSWREIVDLTSSAVFQDINLHDLLHTTRFCKLKTNLAAEI